MISSQAFEKLSAMGIQLYQLKGDDSNPSESDFLTIDEQQFKESQLFNDFLSALELTMSDVEFSQQLIELGLFSWCFHDSDEVSFEANRLITPVLEEIKQSPALKNQIWQVIAQ